MRGKEGRYLLLLALPLIMKVLGPQERKEDGSYGQKFLVPLNPLINIKITVYFNCKLRFNDVFSRYKLLKIKDMSRISMTNKIRKRNGFLRDKKLCTSILFGIGCIPQEALGKIKDKSITHNTLC